MIYLIRLIFTTFFLLACSFFIACGGGSSSLSLSSLHSQKVMDVPQFPVRIAFLPDGTLLIAELQSGTLSSINLDSMESKLIIRVGASTQNGNGISGLLVDNRYSENSFVYLYYIDSQINRYVLDRLSVRDSTLLNRKRISTLLPPSSHNGGGMVQDHDGGIFLALGDGDSSLLSQDPSTLHGTILRITPDGAVPIDNPIATSMVYSFGIRNVFGLTIDSSERVLALNNGPECNDSIFEVKPLANYGWRENYNCDEVLDESKFIAPLYTWHVSEGVSDLLLYKGSKYGLKGKLLAGIVNSGEISVLDYNENMQISELGRITSENEGILVSIAEAPDGQIYYSSNSAIYKLEQR